MPTLKVVDSTKDLLIECANPILATDVKVRELLDLLNEMSAAIPDLDTLSYKIVSGNWVYKFANGTRIWKQKVVPGATVEDYTMSFDVPDQWEMSEFMTNRPVRDAVFTMQLQYGLTKFEVTFL